MRLDKGRPQVDLFKAGFLFLRHSVSELGRPLCTWQKRLPDNQKSVASCAIPTVRTTTTTNTTDTDTKNTIKKLILITTTTHTAAVNITTTTLPSSPPTPNFHQHHHILSPTNTPLSLHVSINLGKALLQKSNLIYFTTVPATPFSKGCLW